MNIKKAETKLSSRLSSTGYKKCIECGRIFYIDIFTSWIYKRYVKRQQEYLCSYSCCRKYDKKHDKTRGNLQYLK